MKRFLYSAVAVLASIGCDRAAVTASKQGMNSLNVIESVVGKGDTVALLAFLQAMPKGGDLHNHLAGAIPAEQMIAWAAEEKLCVSEVTQALSAAPCDGRKHSVTAAKLLTDSVLRNRTIDAWTMRNYAPGGKESPHMHFFGTFDKFLPALAPRFGEMLAVATAAAARDHVMYLELMVTPDEGGIIPMGAGLTWDSSVTAMRAKALKAGLVDSLTSTSKALDRAEAIRRTVQHCDTATPDAGCSVQVRYLYQVLRGLPTSIVFTQILAGYEWATRDPRVVGFNLVMPEFETTASKDFDGHMLIIDSLHQVYPQVLVTLHAGEAYVPVRRYHVPSHIRKSIDIGHAIRIGHGVSIDDEDAPDELLAKMAREKILVEIALTSNRLILGVSGDKHPLTEYRYHKVPTALVTDDAGVSRSDMTHEFLAAVLDQRLDYPALKEMVRNSIEYSFAEPGLKAQLKARLEEELTSFEKVYLVAKKP